MTETSMLLQCFLHVDRKGEIWVDEVSQDNGILVCTCGKRACFHIRTVAMNIGLYRNLNSMDHTPAARREYIIHQRTPLTSGKST